MRSLTPQEQRTVRLGSIALAAYLALYFGAGLWQSAERYRRDYGNLVREAAAQSERMKLLADKAISVEQMMEQLQLDPSRLSTNTVVADAMAALQLAATQGGVELGPIRETASRAAAQEIAAVQLEGAGSVASVLDFLHRIGRLGYPLMADAVQLTPNRTQPGSVKLSLTLVILDFAHWTSGKRKPDA